MKSELRLTGDQRTTLHMAVEKAIWENITNLINVSKAQIQEDESVAKIQRGTMYREACANIEQMYTEANDKIDLIVYEENIILKSRKDLLRYVNDNFTLDEIVQARLVKYAEEDEVSSLKK